MAVPSNGGKSGRPATHVALIIQFVVGELQLVKTDHLSHPSLPRGRRVRMNVHAGWHRGVSIARHHPFRAVINIPGRQGQGSFVDCCFLGISNSVDSDKMDTLLSLKFKDLLFTFNVYKMRIQALLKKNSLKQW